jgi:hypothetical protein
MAEITHRFRKVREQKIGRPTGTAGSRGRPEDHGILGYSQKQNRASEDASAALTLLSTRWADGSRCWRSTG